MLTIDEMEILKSALEGDIMRQKEYLTKLTEDGGSDVRFEMWLDESQRLLKKISVKLMDMKANAKLTDYVSKGRV